MAGRQRLLIADDCVLFAKVCRLMLEGEFEIVDVVSDGEQLVREAMVKKPDVILADINLPILNGVEAGRQLREAMPSMRLVLMTADVCFDFSAVGLRNVASAFVLKGDSAALVDALKPSSGWSVAACSD